MRMRWLAAGLALGGLAGAVVPVIAQAPILQNNMFHGVGPGGWLVLGCVDASGNDRRSVTITYRGTNPNSPNEVQITCPP